MTAFRSAVPILLAAVALLGGADAACYDDTPPTCDACFDDKTCCMEQNFNIYNGGSGIGCTANSLAFSTVTGFTVFDDLAWNCNCQLSCAEGDTTCTTCAAKTAAGEEPLNCEGKPMGTVFDACLGADDYVTVSFTIDLQVKGTQYDVGLYIATDGGEAKTGGQCVISGLTRNDPNTTTPWVNEDGDEVVGVGEGHPAPPDDCWDFIAAGYLSDYPFEKVTLKCFDSPAVVPGNACDDGTCDCASPPADCIPDTPGDDGLLDFSVAASFSQSAGDMCSYDGPIDLDVDGTLTLHAPPFPGTKSKCWGGQRITLPINVPEFNTPSISPSVSSAPSESPSTSAKPSSVPSESPSVSVEPTPSPSMKPSVSSKPSSVPSESPSVSVIPSQYPSSQPSSLPSLQPSSNPSEAPSGQPSSNPSEAPSGQPSSDPTLLPSSIPSEAPSGQPSSVPSESPSTSSKPSLQPSVNPTTSAQPSVSLHPSSNTRWPSGQPSLLPSESPSHEPTETPTVSPSISQEPTPSPSDSPSTSKNPTLSPTYAPSDSPSAPPTGSLYYPDWDNVEQICVNDGADPAYMKQIQRENYLYRSKEECCQTHFWWRVAQCMDNEHRLYTSDGEKCDTVVNLEQWDVKYTPQEWESSDLFETLQECCNAKFWYDVPGCMANSPKEIVFELEFDLTGLIEPTICQDADTIANALAVAMEVGLDGGDANVTQIGCATLSKNPDTSNPECGGCLAGASFSGDWDGTREAGYYESYNVSQPTTIKVEISSQCEASACPDPASMTAMYEKIWADFQTFVNSGSLEGEIHQWANDRAPPVPELFFVQVDTSSLTTDGTFTNPLANPEDTVEVIQITTEGTLAVPNLNEPVEVVEVTATGSFTDVSLDTSGLDAAQIEEVAGHYEGAIAEQLGLPDGSTVQVTSIENGVVEYEVTVYADSSADATSVINTATTSLSQSTAMSGITTLVNAALNSSLDADIAGMGDVSVDSNSPGTTSSPTTTSQTTVSGELSVSGLSSYSPAETLAAMSIFESALNQEMADQGLLPDGASVVVTGIDENTGTVQYEVHFYGTSSAESSTAITQIESSLSQASTLTSIATTVEDDSESSALGLDSGVSIPGNEQLVTTGLTMTAAEEAEAIEDYEAAIVASLGSNLPAGATVTVTGIENGVVSYEVTMAAASSEDADAAVAAIQASLDDTTTQGAITNAVATASEITTVTTAGTLSTGLTLPPMSDADEKEAKAIIADAIETSLSADLPDGAIVTVTEIADNGEVSYFITMPVESDATVEANAVQTAVSANVSDIATAVATASSSSSSTVIQGALSGVTSISNTPGSATTTTSTMNALAGASVAGNTAGATSQSVVAEVTSSGQLTTTVTGLTDADEIAEASKYFEDAITATLEAEGALPEGAVVTATIDSLGVVSYEITMYLTPGADNALIVNKINSELESSSTMTAIADAVETSAATSSISALQSLDVTGFTPGETKGVSFKPWYPNWISYGSYCNNDGNNPPFMNEPSNQGEYLFSTQQECCDKWYSYADDCVGSSGSPDAERFYPVYGSGPDGGMCSKKAVKDFAGYEQERYESLVDCCVAKFSHNMEKCCDAPGMGGCSASGEVVYLPDYYGKKCVSRSKGALAGFEEEYAKDSISECCTTWLWSATNCLEESA